MNVWSIWYYKSDTLYSVTHKVRDFKDDLKLFIWLGKERNKFTVVEKNKYQEKRQLKFCTVVSEVSFCVDTPTWITLYVLTKTWL